jgi:hypothetical protein
MGAKYMWANREKIRKGKVRQQSVGGEKQQKSGSVLLG